MSIPNSRRNLDIAIERLAKDSEEAVSAGGLITTLLEMTFANVEGGMKINLHDIADADIIKTLFAENPGVVIQVSDAHKDELKAFFDENGIGYAKIGYPAPELRKIIIKKEGFEHEFDIDALRDDWYKTSYLLDRKQSMNGMAKKRYTNYKKQPIEMNFGYGFKGTLASYSLDANRRKPSGIKAAIIREKGTNVMLVLREFQTSENSQNNVVCVIDDDRDKLGKYIRNVKIAGTREDIVALAQSRRIEEIVLAIPTAAVRERRNILQLCQKTGCRLKILPGIYQLANGEVNIQKIRNVDVQDLLGRDCVKVDLSQIAGYLSGKTILVTGGGGSIGSELCRQIARHTPKRLVLLDIYENNAYAIEQELHRTHPELDLAVCIGSVRDEMRVSSLFAQYRPDIVFHAAAHKHVPLMEGSPNEAIKNNVFGTLHVAQAADRYGTETFVLISTDKAVNPTNVMGASKRICEMIVQTMAERSKTKFVAVRFGNVLGSNGSVIPLFRRQIEEGGPVTVTHPDIIRYFMTIPEAVSLVLQAGAYAGRGEIFVLDMGEPVRIDDLARNLIRLSGFEPDVDIEVRYTGLRPGEKLYEEMLMQEEGLRSTPNHLIHIGRPLDIDVPAFERQLTALAAACRENSPAIRTLLAQVVPTYHPEAGGRTAANVS